MYQEIKLENVITGCKKLFLTLITVTFFTFTIKAQSFSEDFAVVEPLPAGWAQQNLSTPVGLFPTWIQGQDVIFPAQNGGVNSYAGCSHQSVAGANTISNWLFTPTVTLNNGDMFSFWTRTVAPATFSDRLQLRMSTNGASVDVGVTNTSVGDFTTLLLDINSTYVVVNYPSIWTQYSVTISGLGGPTSGRFAFRYFVENGGPAGANSDFIGVDNVVYTSTMALPVELVQFAGNNEGDRNELQWTTATENNNKGFEIQRSIDGVNFTTLGFVSSQSAEGNSTTSRNYTFTDDNISAYAYYYRLNQIDFDGQSSYSDIIQVKGELPANWTITDLFPNPASTEVNVIIPAPNRDQVTLSVTDMTGRIVLSTTANLEAGNNILPIDISFLANGTYFVKLAGCDNCETVVSRFVKQ
jgi:hypothetical protein